MYWLWIDARRRDRRLRELVARAEAVGVPVETVEGQVLDQMLGHGERHQGVVARYSPLPVLAEDALASLLHAVSGAPLVLVLDEVTDPHNLGACLRTADAAGVTAVVTPRDRSARLTPAVRKVASGAAEVVPLVQVTNLARAMQELKGLGLWLVGMADEAGQSLYGMDLRLPLALVLGAEGRGLRRLTAERCDHLAALPMQGAVESLNVSVAAGICLYEALRQRGAALAAATSGG